MYKNNFRTLVYDIFTDVESLQKVLIISNYTFVQQPRCFYISPPWENGKWEMVKEEERKYAQKF